MNIKKPAKIIENTDFRAECLGVHFEHMFCCLERHLPHTWRKHGSPGNCCALTVLSGTQMSSPHQLSKAVRVRICETAPPQQTGEQCESVILLLRSRLGSSASPGPILWHHMRGLWTPGFLFRGQPRGPNSSTLLVWQHAWLATPFAIALCHGLHVLQSPEFSLR